MERQHCALEDRIETAIGHPVAKGPPDPNVVDLPAPPSRAHWCTFGLAGTKPVVALVSANPSICRDGHCVLATRRPD
jgi:hypothetical protein